MTTERALTPEEQFSWDAQGFFIRRRFAGTDMTERMLDRVVEICRSASRPDDRPGSNYGHVQIVDYDMSAAIPVLMDPGDLLVFSSKLMHSSTDNDSDGIRAAMVYHYSPAGTIDRSVETEGFTVNDWMPVRRRSASEAVHAPR